MKKTLAILLTLAMLLSMAACGSGAQSAASAASEPAAVSSVEEVSAAVSAAEPEAEEPAAAEEPVVEDTSDQEASAEEPEEEPVEEEVPEVEEIPEVPEDRIITVTDMSGDEVTIEGRVEHIVNLWPAGTSSFFVMGAGDLVAGMAVNNAGVINSWAKTFYPAAGDVPAMGGTTPSIEELMALDPDLVIVHPMTVSTGYAQQIRDAGIPAVNINFSNYDSMITAYTMIGEILGGVYQVRLQKWCDMIAEKQAEIEAVTASLSEEDRPVVYYIAGQADRLTTTMGSNSICADWTALAGGVYATTLMDDPTATEVTAEELLAIDPDVIIVGGTYQHKLVEELQTTDGWKELSAVENGRVYTNPYGAFAWDRFGLESYFQMDYALLCIQPELAAENGIDRASITQEVMDFYKMMNGTELTEEQVGYMIDGLEPDGTEVDPDAAGAGMGQGGGRPG